MGPRTHWACWAQAPERVVTVRRWAEQILEDARQCTDRAPALVGEDALVIAYDDRPNPALVLVPMLVGSWIPIASTPWPRTWVEALAARRAAHEIELAARSAASAECARRFPSPAAAWSSIDWEPRRALALRHRQTEQERREARQRVLDAHNEACHRLAERVSMVGVACPHCRWFLKADFRYMDNRPGDRSYLICRRCGCSFGPSDEATSAPR